MKTLTTESGIKIEVRSIRPFGDNAKVLESGHVEDFQVDVVVEATLASGASKNFTVSCQSADTLTNKLRPLEMLFARHYGADWDESGKLAKFVGYDDCYEAWDEIGEFLLGIAESECKKWHDDCYKAWGEIGDVDVAESECKKWYNDNKGEVKRCNQQ